MKNKDRVQYTLKHRKAFRKVEKQLLDNDLLERKEEIINSL